MKYKYGHQRELAIIESWRRLHGNVPHTMQEVAEWAVKNYLYPVPKLGSSTKECEAWEERLERAMGTLSENRTTVR